MTCNIAQFAQRPIKSALAVLAAFFYCPLLALAGGDELLAFGLNKTDRYTMARLSPRADQMSPLDAVVTISFGPSVTTIGGALNELLDGTGYCLVHIKGQYDDSADKILMSQALPGTLMHVGPVKLRDALVTLGGSAWSLQYNELGREVWFDLKQDYEDDSRIRRLLSAVTFREAQIAEKLARDVSSRYITFPPGKSAAKDIGVGEQQQLDSVANLVINNPDIIKRIFVRGESQSNRQYARAALAKSRADVIASALIKRGVPAEKIDKTSTHKNNAPEARHGVYVDLDVKSEVRSNQTSAAP